MYRASSSLNQRAEQKESLPSFISVSSAFAHVLYFALLPIVVLVVLHWTTYPLTRHTFYQDAWMAPLLLLLGTFASGVVIRQRIEDIDGKIGFFLLGLIGLLAFTALSYFDIQLYGRIYSHFLPHSMGKELVKYVLLLPLDGLLGMVFFKPFSWKA